MNRTYGLLVATKRKAKGYSQLVLSSKIGCAMSTISKIENGVWIPKLNTFSKINQELGIKDITFEELQLQENIKNRQVEDDFLTVMANGRTEELERKMERFREVANKNTIEHQQYLEMGDLIWMKKKGMEPGEFIDRCISIFEKRRTIPNFAELSNQSIDKIEHLILFKLGMAHFEIGNIEISVQIIQGLLENCIEAGNDYIRKRWTNISISLANILLKDDRRKDAEKCVRYIMARAIESFDFRIVFQGLNLQYELYMLRAEYEGAALVNNFLESAQALVNFMHRDYRRYH